MQQALNHNTSEKIPTQEADIIIAELLANRLRVTAALRRNPISCRTQQEFLVELEKYLAVPTTSPKALLTDNSLHLAHRISEVDKDSECADRALQLAGAIISISSLSTATIITALTAILHAASWVSEAEDEFRIFLKNNPTVATSNQKIVTQTNETLNEAGRSALAAKALVLTYLSDAKALAEVGERCYSLLTTTGGRTPQIDRTIMGLLPFIDVGAKNGQIRQGRQQSLWIWISNNPTEHIAGELASILPTPAESTQIHIFQRLKQSLINSAQKTGEIADESDSRYRLASLICKCAPSHSKDFFLDKLKDAHSAPTLRRVAIIGLFNSSAFSEDPAALWTAGNLLRKDFLDYSKPSMVTVSGIIDPPPFPLKLVFDYLSDASSGEALAKIIIRELDANYLRYFIDTIKLSDEDNMPMQIRGLLDIFALFANCYDPTSLMKNVFCSSSCFFDMWRALLKFVPDPTSSDKLEVRPSPLRREEVYEILQISGMTHTHLDEIYHLYTVCSQYQAGQHVFRSSEIMHYRNNIAAFLKMLRDAAVECVQ